MEQNNIYIQLEELLHITVNYEEASRAINAAQIDANSAEEYTPSRLKTFDETYKENFILSIAGEEPKPAAMWNPLNHTKKGKESGVRGIRNIMTHRNAYQYCLEGTDGKALPFAEPGTWTIVFESYAPRIIQILYEIINNSHWKIEE